MELVITNEKGLFANLDARPVITEQGFSYLKKWRAAQSDLDPAEASKIDTLIAAFESLPLMLCSSDLDRNDREPGTQLRERSISGLPCKAWAEVPARVWVAVVSFTGTFSRQGWDGEATPEALGWSALPALLKLREFQARFLPTIGVANGGYQPYEGASRIVKGHPRWTLNLVDPVAKLGEDEAHAIYSPGEKGYLNDKGVFVSLSGARLFESAEAARRTVRSRNLAGVVIVGVKIAVSTIEDTLRETDLGDFAGVLATAERRRLTEMLDKIELAELLDKVDRIRAVHPELFEDKPVSPRSRL
jgi:hypothetical protein